MSKKFPLLNLNLEFLDLEPCRFASINVFVLSLSDFICMSWQSSKPGLEVLWFDDEGGPPFARAIGSSQHCIG